MLGQNKLRYCALISLICGFVSLFIMSEISTFLLKHKFSQGNETQTYHYANYTRTAMATKAHDHDGPTFVLILAYMRSGSSFTGDLIQHHPDVFYRFEPLYNLKNRYTRVKNISDDVLISDDEYAQRQLEILKKWFTCNLTSYKAEIFMDRGLKTRQYTMCVRGKNNTRILRAKCLQQLIQACQQSKFRVIKTIRLSVKSISKYFSETPNFKIIHLIRDPRAIGSSRSKLYKKSNRHYNRLCPLMTNNLKAGSKLRPQSRYRILRYETVAENPFTSMYDIYKFIGLTPTFESIGQLYLDTHSDTNVEKTYGTTRQNSTQTANQWRLRVTKDYVQEMNENCAQFYLVADYFKADINLIKDISKPLRPKENGTFFRLSKI
ncbi:carbohydrate sulfotransferase 1 [Patella vulgata]|uniref:carbohydrate sulfotransferase 1 n=1 Tax=Patella vulgata TaxID=6465 RepID=UPI00217F6FA5|nr:carbohydrate sulfotransferase 1 [Patella vulgata]XP_050406811.1 carbohydrate sulfotransferase 1 [Patella vulgata]XP_050406812.1 carbohydrate sulfotransferase 1 [Patella vulgata]